MFGAIIIPAAVGGVIGSTRFGERIWPGTTMIKGALLGAGLGFGYAVLRSKSGVSGIMGNIDMQRKYFSPEQGYRQVVYQRSISAGGLFDSIRLI